MRIYNLIITLTLIQSFAFSKCLVAVGGPGLNLAPASKFVNELNKSFAKNKTFNLNAVYVESLPQATSLDADYIVYLNGSASIARVEFRDLLLNRVLFSDTYSIAIGLDTAISLFVSSLNTQVLPKLPNYCR